MKQKLQRAISYFLDQLGQASTWQGIGFIVGLASVKYGNLDWGQAAGLGGAISATIKILFPDNWGK